MSFFSFSKKNKESYSLVFNIGSGSVSGGIVKFTEKEGVDMVHYAKELIPFQTEISVPKHLELMKASLATLADKIRAEGLVKIDAKKGSSIVIDRVFYLFSSPWSVSQTRTIRVKETKPFKVTEGYLSKLINEQEKQFQTDVSQTGKIIEKKIVQIKINGYVINDIHNRTTKELQASVFFTVVPDDILRTVEEAVSKTFHIKNVWCHSFSLAAFSLIRDMFPQKEDFIHLDVSEEMTDISIVKDNVMTSGASIPLGRNDFMRELATVLKVSPEIADSMLKMHAQKNNNELATLNQSVSLDTAARNWLTKIFEVLDSLKEKIYVPESIFLIAGSDLIPFLKEKLEKHDFKVILVDNRKIKSKIVVDDIIFRLELMFLDNLYKI